MASVYIVGSLRNPEIPKVDAALRAGGHTPFSEWYSAGEFADDAWMAYEQYRGRSYAAALNSPHAWNVFRFDKYHLDRSDAAVLVMPAGKSGHLELGYFIGTGKPGYVLLDREPDRFDVMLRFCTGVFYDIDALVHALKGVA